MMPPVDTVAATQLVREAYQFIEDVQLRRRHDYEDAYPERFAESFELVLPPDYPEGEQSYRGPTGLKRWIEGVQEIWDEWRMEPERVIWAGDQVVALIHISARGHLSGVELDRETAHIWSISDGLVTRCEVYFERSEALDEVIGS